MKREYGGHANKGGVYQITNQVSNKVYIGSCKCFKKRANQHRASLNASRHHNRHLQASWNKHGADAFLFEVIEVVNGDKLARTTREQEYIDEHLGDWESCYNLDKKSVSRKRSCHSANPKTTKEKLKELWDDPDRRTRFSAMAKKRWESDVELRRKLERHQYKKGQASPRKGKNHTEEANKKNREAHLGKKHSEATKAKMSKAQKGRKFSQKHKEALRTRRLFVLENDFIAYRFTSQAEAVELLNLNSRHLSSVILGKRKSHRGFRVVLLQDI